MRVMLGRLQMLRRFCADRDGTTAIEYALIASGVSIAVVTAVLQVGDSMKAMLYDKIVATF